MRSAIERFDEIDGRPPRARILAVRGVKFQKEVTSGKGVIGLSWDRFRQLDFIHCD
jgi:hypothetical protein